MNTSSLQDIVAKARMSGRIGFADVRRLRRDVLADGVGSRAEAELLLGLDRSLVRRDPAWERFLVAAIADFVVWAERPTGAVDEGTARWLRTVLDGTTSARTARLLAREVAEAAHLLEEAAAAALAAIGRGRPSDRRSRVATAATLPAPPLGAMACQSAA